MTQVIALINNPKLMKETRNWESNIEESVFILENDQYKIQHSQIPKLRRQFQQLNLNY